MNRRKFAKTGLVSAAGIALVTGFYTWQVEPFWLEFVHRRMPIRNLPDDLVGKMLIQISDLHVGDRFDYNYIISSLQRAQALDPDYVVYTGDYVSYESAKQYDQLHEVLAHAAVGRAATVGILGNHDYGASWAEQEVADTIATILEDHKIALLSNTQMQKGGINFIGLDDYWGLNFNPDNIMSLYNPELPNVLLCHNPDVCDLDVWQGYQGWILAGHTHGGQCKPPFLSPPMLPVQNKLYAAGEIDLKDGRTLYINRALGHLWQVRFNVRPEITVFTLDRAS